MFLVEGVKHVKLEMVPIRVMGMKHDGREALLEGLKPDDVVELVREPGNAYDLNAVTVMLGDAQCGYLPRAVARLVAKSMDEYGKRTWACVLEVVREPVPSFTLAVLKPEEA